MKIIKLHLEAKFQLKTGKKMLVHDKTTKDLFLNVVREGERETFSY